MTFCHSLLVECLLKAHVLKAGLVLWEVEEYLRGRGVLSLGHWENDLKSDPGTSVPFSFFYFIVMSWVWFCSATHFHHNVLITNLKQWKSINHRLKPLKRWEKKYTFCFQKLIIISICYSNRRLTNTYMANIVKKKVCSK